MKRQIMLMFFILLGLTVVYATGSIEKSDVKNQTFNSGKYVGEAPGYEGTTKVEVEISNNKIISITILSYDDTKEYMESTKDKIINAVLKGQTTEVDAISGATDTSFGIIEAVENALEKARMK